MAYEIDIDPAAQDQIRALPASLLIALAEAMTMLEVAPWNGAPQHSGNPDAEVRQVLFGAGGNGIVTYLILEDQQRVDVLMVQWMG